MIAWNLGDDQARRDHRISRDRRMAILSQPEEWVMSMTAIRTLVGSSLAAMIVAGGLSGCSTSNHRTARLNDVSAGESRATAALADRTRRILAQRDGEGATALAERLVAAEPHNAAYRQLLGQSYLQAGRFASARQAFADALQLDPNDGRSALNLALAMIAGGDGAGARTLLDAHAASIPAADRGLALALGGASGEAVHILTAAAREQGATAKTRQNLALALALSGQWDMARMAASADMAPADVEARMQQWADFVRVGNPAEQVAALLGVRPAVDTGQPITLAINAAPSAVVVADMARALPQSEPAAAPAMAESAAPPPAPVFAASKPVVQALVEPLQPAAAPMATGPAPSLTQFAAAPVSAPALLRRAEARQPRRAHGDWNVQIGAFGQEANAQKAWAQLTRQLAGLAEHVPLSGVVHRPEGTLHRLSIGGLSRAEADALCGRYRGEGGACFVRQQADDRMARWARPGIGMASL